MDDPTTRLNEAADAADDDPTVARRTRELRRDIEHTRDEMSETIEAIQDKLRPGNIVASATDRVKEAATGRVRQMRHSAEQAYGRLRSNTGRAGIAGEAGQNRIPMMLMGIGAAWWLMNRRSAGEYESVRRERGYRGTSEADFGDDYGPEQWHDDAATGIAESARDATVRAREYGRDAAEHVRDTGRRAQSQLQRMARENPLAVGAGALLLGSLVGLIIPETERENELLGEARDSMLERAQEMARSAATRAQDTAADLVGDATSRIVGGSDS